jgi:hypothetical protein
VRVGHRLREGLVVFALQIDAAHPQLVMPQLDRVIQYLVDDRRDLLGLVRR